MQLDKAALQWADQLMRRFHVKPGYGDYVLSVLKANEQSKWQEVMQILRGTQPEWFK